MRTAAGDFVADLIFDFVKDGIDPIRQAISLRGTADHSNVCEKSDEIVPVYFSQQTSEGDIMSDPNPTPSFPILLQGFFVEHLGNQRAVSSRTIAAYRDTFRLLLGFAEAKIGKTPTRLILADLNAQLILDFLDHLEKERSNGVRTRNARLAALRSFLKSRAVQPDVQHRRPRV